MVYAIVKEALPQLSWGKATIITILKQSVNESRFSLFIEWLIHERDIKAIGHQSWKLQELNCFSWTDKKKYNIIKLSHVYEVNSQYKVMKRNKTDKR